MIHLVAEFGATVLASSNPSRMSRASDDSELQLIMLKPGYIIGRTPRKHRRKHANVGGPAPGFGPLPTATIEIRKIKRPLATTKAMWTPIQELDSPSELAAGLSLAVSIVASVQGRVSSADVMI